jgi:hypothetical protein
MRKRLGAHSGRRKNEDPRVRIDLHFDDALAWETDFHTLLTPLPAHILRQRVSERARGAGAAGDRREFSKMAGAAAFYARKRRPAYEKVLIDLLNQSRDLAVAQDLILARDPSISEPARKWAAKQASSSYRRRRHPPA